MPTASPIQDHESTTWTYPPAWTPEQREQWEHTQGELAAVTKATEAAIVGSEAALATPEALLSETRARIAEAKRTADRLRRATAGTLAWYQASATHGADVARVDSEEGDVVIMLYMTPAEINHANDRAHRLLDAARANVPEGADDKARKAALARGREEYDAAHLDEVLKKSAVGGLAPEESTKRLRYLTGRYAGLAARLIAMRDNLVMGFRVREEKDSAP